MTTQDSTMPQLPTPDIHPALKPFQAEFDAAAARGDEAAMRAIVERAGLTWIDPLTRDETSTSGVRR